MTTATATKNTKQSNADNLQRLIGPTDPKIDAAARECIINARVELLIQHAFFGNMATRLRPINADEWCATAATDGRNLYYNSRFITMLKQREVTFLIGHEVLHVVYDHIGRREDRDPTLSNIAADYAVNADLKKHRVGEFITSVPCLYDPKYTGWAYEAIYDDLFDKADKINLSDLIDKLLDDHMENQEGDGNGSGDGKDGKDNKRPQPMSQEERDQLRQEIKQNILNAARQASAEDKAGTIPDNVKRMIHEMTNPRMPWRELIQTNLTSAIKTDYSFMRPSRRGWHMDAIMPATTPGEEIDVDVFIDLSGSISNEQGRQFISEVAGMMDAFDGYRINIACFDTEVYNPQTFTSENMDTVDEYELRGGGGTDFDCIFRFLKQEGRVPNRLIVFTDGYPFGSWGDADYCDTTWIIHGDPNPNPPFGTFAIYDDHKRKQ